MSQYRTTFTCFTDTPATAIKGKKGHKKAIVRGLTRKHTHTFPGSGREIDRKKEREIKKGRKKFDRDKGREIQQKEKHRTRTNFSTHSRQGDTNTYRERQDDTKNIDNF